MMTTLSQRTLTNVGRTYHQAYGLQSQAITLGGELVGAGRRAGFIGRLSSGEQTAAYGLQEALHWGEPFVFCWVPGVFSWAVAMVDQHQIHGGLLGGEVLSRDKPAAEALQGLVEQGFTPKAARALIAGLPVWPAARIREAALFLHKTFYQFSGWKPVLLEENRVKAVQQRQISAAIDTQRKSGQTGYSIDKERMLLSLIRAGDKNAARRVLNEMLGAMFLFSPQLVVLRARAIEMMGYLTRAAIEDSPLLEPLIERNHQWMQRLIRAPDFETLAHVLMRALDDFMEGIYAHGFNCYNPRVSRILDFIAQNYTKSLTLGQIAREMGLSAFRISHLIKQSTGKTMLQHVMRLRIQKAQELLESASLSCSEIAYATGFCDQSYFVKHFKRVAGTTPARYRRARFVAAPGAA